jgi:hypothetical protein
VLDYSFSMGKNLIKLAVGTLAFITLTVGATMGLLQLNPVLFPVVGEPTAAYDCDDDTLAMYRHFEELGIESTPVVGNLDITGETYMQSNHVWLLVGSGPNKIAYDWGTPRLDRQHYEGFRIDLDYLLYVVQQDAKSPDLLPIAEDR